MTVSFNEAIQMWWPDYDKRPVEGVEYQRRRVTDVDLTANLCRARHTVVQAGGWVGMWPLRLATLFDRVITFEGDPDTFASLALNVAKTRNVEAHEMVLGSEVGTTRMKPSKSSGVWQVDSSLGTVPVDQVTVDSLQLTECDAIILDVEAHEVEVLLGAARTIKKFRPVIHVEELPRSRAAIGAHMQSLGYAPRVRVHGDVIYAP